MSEQDLLLIEQYYRSELSEAERLAFEQRMAEDGDFREEAQLHQRAMNAIRLHGKEILKKKLQERPIIAPDRPSLTWWWAGAAVFIVGMVSFGYWYTQQVTPAPSIPPTSSPSPPKDTAFQRNALPPVIPTPPSNPPTNKQQPDPEKLFAAAYKPYRDGALGIGTNRSGAQMLDTSRLAALNNMKQMTQEGKYAESLIAFEQLSQEMQQRPSILFFKANSLMALGRTDEAAILFEAIAGQQTNYAAHAKWYAALCALKKGDLPKAKKWLQAVATGSDTSGVQRREAKNLLAKLR